MLAQLWKVLLEVLADVFIDLAERPDVVLAEADPVLDSLDAPSDDDLVHRFGGLLDAD